MNLWVEFKFKKGGKKNEVHYFYIHNNIYTLKTIILHNFHCELNASCFKDI